MAIRGSNTHVQTIKRVCDEIFFVFGDMPGGTKMSLVIIFIGDIWMELAVPNVLWNADRGMADKVPDHRRRRRRRSACGIDLRGSGGVPASVSWVPLLGIDMEKHRRVFRYPTSNLFLPDLLSFSALSIHRLDVILTIFLTRPARCHEHTIPRNAHHPLPFAQYPSHCASHACDACGDFIADQGA